METDLSLIINIKTNNDEQSLKELIDRHSGIYVTMVNKTIPDSCDFLNKRDVLEEKDFSIYSAALKFLPEKNTKFSTYLANETRWKCLNLYNKRKKIIEEPIEESFDKKVSEEDFVSELQQNEILAFVLEEAKNHPDKRVKKIIEMRYNQGYNKTQSWRIIAKSLKMSIQGTINIHDKFIEKIKKEYA